MKFYSIPMKIFSKIPVMCSRLPRRDYTHRSSLAVPSARLPLNSTLLHTTQSYSTLLNTTQHYSTLLFPKTPIFLTIRTNSSIFVQFCQYLSTDLLQDSKKSCNFACFYCAHYVRAAHSRNKHFHQQAALLHETLKLIF